MNYLKGLAGMSRMLERPNFEAVLSYDPKTAGAATNAGQAFPVAAPRSAYSREIHQLVTNLAGTPAEAKKRRFAIGLPW